MKVEHEHEFAVPPSKLLEVLTSRAYFEARFAMSGVDDFWFDAYEETERGFLIRVLRELEIRSDKVPAFARRFLGQHYTLTQEFLWTRRAELPYRAEYRFKLGDIPVTVFGEMRITGENGHAGQQYRVEVDSTVPVIGRKLVGLVSERVDKALESDYRGTLKYLRQQGLVNE
jgi:hypothetical protein